VRWFRKVLTQLSCWGRVRWFRKVTTQSSCWGRVRWFRKVSTPVSCWGRVRWFRKVSTQLLCWGRVCWLRKVPTQLLCWRRVGWFRKVLTPLYCWRNNFVITNEIKGNRLFFAWVYPIILLVLTLYVHFHDRKTNFLKNGWTDFFNEIGKNVIISRGWGGNQTICLNALLSFTLSVHYATVHTYIYMCTLWYCILITFLNMETWRKMVYFTIGSYTMSLFKHCIPHWWFSKSWISQSGDPHRKGYLFQETTIYRAYAYELWHPLVIIYPSRKPAYVNSQAKWIILIKKGNNTILAWYLGGNQCFFVRG